MYTGDTFAILNTLDTLHRHVHNFADMLVEVLKVSRDCLMNAILRVSDKIINSDCRVESILENTLRGLDEAVLDGLLLKDSYIVLHISSSTYLLSEGCESCRATYRIQCLHLLQLLDDRQHVYW